MPQFLHDSICKKAIQNERDGSAPVLKTVFREAVLRAADSLIYASREFLPWHVGGRQEDGFARMARFMNNDFTILILLDKIVVDPTDPAGMIEPFTF